MSTANFSTAPTTLDDPFPPVGNDPITITGVRALATMPDGIPLVVVRVDTSEPGLYGWGCATYTQRWANVVLEVEEHIAPLVLGRSVGDIADLNRLVRYAPYWREGPIMNNALSGLDIALWDIAGKRAGLPVHQLVGGRVRTSAASYLHASGASVAEAVEHALALQESGYRHIRVQVGMPGIAHYGHGPSEAGPLGQHAANPLGWDASSYLGLADELLHAAREALDPTTEILHDVHNRLSVAQAKELCHRVADVHPFFLEDVLAPELWDRLPEVRSSTSVPIAVGELATSFTEAARLVTTGSVDYLRCHLSAVGGFSAGLRLASLSDIHGVRTAWHNPGDTSPFGQAVNATLDVISPAFGIQEGQVYSERVSEVFPGTLSTVHGSIRPSDAPGWGLDVDEAAAARHPAVHTMAHDRWAAGVRGLDGGLLAP